MMQVGPIGTNCYILEDDKTNKAAVIDPGDEAGQDRPGASKGRGGGEYILLTHGHYDHTTGVPDLKKRFPDAQVYIHQADANGAGSTLYPLAGQVAGLKHYKEGDSLTLGSLTIQVMETPGHSPAPSPCGWGTCSLPGTPCSAAPAAAPTCGGAAMSRSWPPSSGWESWRGTSMCVPGMTGPPPWRRSGGIIRF